MPLSLRLLAATLVVLGFGCEASQNPLGVYLAQRDTGAAPVQDTTEAPDAFDAERDTDVIDVQPDVPEEDTGRPPEEIVWRRCSFFTGGGGGDAECADVPLPLDWSSGDGEVVEVFVKRLRTPGESRGQLWLLQGGPGGAGDALEGVADLFFQLEAGLDIYIPDHRGTGRSDRLGCPEQERPTGEGSSTITEGEWPACVSYVRERWGEGLAHFTATGAARDLGALIGMARQTPDEPVHVLGFSYGTYWAQRYLQLHPEQPTSVILDSICPPGLCELSTYDLGFDRTGRQFLGRCADDPLCREKLGEDPEAFAEQVFERLEQGHCAQAVEMGLTRPVLRRVLAALLVDWSLRTLIPALIYRLDRCEAGDINALEALVDVLGIGNAPFSELGLHSVVLGNHITLSEMWPEPSPSNESIAQHSEAAIVSPDATLDILPLREGWPVYERDAFVDVWATTQVPMLMLNGTLDPQTPLYIAEPAGEAFQGSNQHFIAIPDAAHATIVQSPTSEGLPCGMSLIMGFLADPLDDPDTACLGDLRPIDFEGDSRVSRWLLGTSDMWENGGDKTDPGRLGSSPEGLERVKRALRGGGPYH